MNSQVRHVSSADHATSFVHENIICSFADLAEPVAWARPRRRGRQWFTDPMVAVAKKKIAFLARGGMRGEMAPKGVAVAIRLLFVFSGQRRASGPHAQRPDLDNLLKLVLDALTGVAWHDDGQVAMIDASKTRGAEPQTIVEVRHA